MLSVHQETEANDIDGSNSGKTTPIPTKDTNIDLKMTFPVILFGSGSSSNNNEARSGRVNQHQQATTFLKIGCLSV